MRRAIAPAIKLLALVAVLGALPSVLAHGDDHEGGMDMDMDMGSASNADAPPEIGPEPESMATYFSFPDHKTTIYAHIALMIVGWVFVLPLGESCPPRCLAAPLLF